MAKLLNEQEEQQVVQAIKAAEKNTSGEIRVHMENSCKGQVLNRAAQVFKTLKMHETELRNGVLFYLAVKDRQFAILGDAGINHKVPDNFWDEIKENMQSAFKEGNFAKGLSEGIAAAGEQLSTHFPYQKDDVNELSDDISYGKE